MRISIWQQFASNHSANYTVVGIFESAEKAYQVGQVILEFIRELVEWNNENNIYDFYKTHGWKPTPVEESLIEKYKIEWDKPLDWGSSINVPGRWSIPIDDFIRIFDKIVFVSTPISDATWQTGNQFIQLFQALGGTSARDTDLGARSMDENENESFELCVDISCAAPSLLIAEEVFGKIQALFEGKNAHDMPWVIYHPKFAEKTDGISPEDYWEQERIFFQEANAWSEFYKAHVNKKDISGFGSYRDQFFKQDEKIRDMIYHLRYDVDFSSGSAKRADLHLELQALNARRYQFGIPSIISWLEASGFTGIEYKFYDIRHQWGVE
ncbi:MAG: hypothetical protein DPW16_19370 [Chloroflexi bacterium]|nr:hypothetical protein [Chloroflexota bacterium]